MGIRSGLVVITLAVIGLVIYCGKKLSKAVQEHAPDSDFAVSITRTGNVLYACVVGFWIVCAVARELKPESSLGAYLGRADGVLAVIVGSIFFIAIAGAILEKLGYPIVKRGGN